MEETQETPTQTNHYHKNFSEIADRKRLFPYKYDSDTETDGDVSWKARLKEFEPHSVYRNRTYPKTGGRLGNCYLLWGNELKHDYFPFVAIVGPDWKMLFLTLSLPVIVLLCYVGYSITLQAFEFWGFIVAIVVCMFSELFFLMTTMSNPGIVFRGMRPSTENNPVQCEECHCDRVSLRVHHCYRCNLCHYKLDHHCIWMGKCIAVNNLKFFWLSLVFLYVCAICCMAIPFIMRNL